MALIKCPECGHTVLSVASACPTCNSPLPRQQLLLSTDGSLTECRRCARPVYTLAPSCPHCGARRPGRPRTSPLAYGGLVAAIVFAVTTREPAPLARNTPAEAPRAPLPPVIPVPVERDTVPARDSAPPPAPPDSRAVLTTAPDSRVPVRTGPPSRPRWATRWVNVRAGPADSAVVVTLLRPGQRVDTGEPRLGWAPIYLDGVLVGYAAGGLLTSRPPDP